MERDLYLVKEVLVRIEKFPFKIEENFDYNISIDGFTNDEVKYHIYLLHQAKFIEGAVQPSSINKHINIVENTLNLTWKGHEFLDTLRNTTVWERIKHKRIMKDVPFELLFSFGKNIILEYLKNEMK